jgi:predicted amidohydrolase YtcJ
MRYGILTLFILGVMSSCVKNKEKADVIVYNAMVYTVDESFSIHEAFAVRNGRFLEVGTNETILEKFVSDNKIDAEGKAVYPGFIDAHCHFFSYGVNHLTKADLVGTKSFQEVIELMVAHHQNSRLEWLEGRGWDQNDWEIKEFPTKELLDKTFPKIPVILTRIDGHAAIVNSEVLNRAGITAQSRIQGGEIQLSDGEPTGILIDNAMNLISNVIPALNEEYERTALQLAEKHCFAVGLTSVQDAGLGKDTIDLIDQMHREGALKIRIYAMLTPSEVNIEPYIKTGPYSTERLTVRSVKLYADGALGSRGAKMLEPYSDDPATSGLFLYEPEYYIYYCQKALEAGFQVNTHAIGDAANRFVLKMYAGFLKGKNDKRWRIEHAQVIRQDDFRMFEEYSIIPSVQPTHATSDMYWAADRVGPERLKGAYAYKNLLVQNGWLPLGTDFPVETINPLYTFYSAVSRKDLNGWPENGFQPENALSREEALRGITIWAAKAAFEESFKGSIEKNKFADFVILNEDIMISEIGRIPSVKVIAAFCNGERVYELAE